MSTCPYNMTTTWSGTLTFRNAWRGIDTNSRRRARSPGIFNAVEFETIFRMRISAETMVPYHPPENPQGVN